MTAYVEEPEIYQLPEVRCGDCHFFIPDFINPAAGIGNCACNGRGSRQRVGVPHNKYGEFELQWHTRSIRPFTTGYCEDWESK